MGKKDTPLAEAYRATYRPAEGFPLRIAALEAAWSRSRGGAGPWREADLEAERRAWAGGDSPAHAGLGAEAGAGAGAGGGEGGLVPYGTVGDQRRGMASGAAGMWGGVSFAAAGLGRGAGWWGRMGRGSVGLLLGR